MTDRARILVVDDEMGPRESLRMILKPRHDIATADSGEAALRTLRTFHPDLIFMDIKMPQMDGIELLRRIKAIDGSIEVVMITAYASLETVKNALTHGAFEYLIKPIDLVDLGRALERALRRPGPPGRARRSWSAVVVSSAERTAAIGVDRLLGTADVVVRTLPALIADRYLVLRSGKKRLRIDRRRAA